jgi:RNA polymerase sigma-70 factor (ECF subfamily)
VETSLTWLGRLTTAPSGADWQRLVDLYGPLLHDWLARAGVPPTDRDDLTQEVLLVLVREVSGFDRRGPGAFRAWLRGILANRARDYFRDRARLPAPGNGLEELADPASELSLLWDREHNEYVAARALGRARVDFSETTWEAFTRQVLEGRPARDVAAELGISRNAALIAKSRVLCRLRAELAGLTD